MSRCRGEMKDRGEGVLHCSYCGSLSVQDAIRFLKQPGTRFSGSDWKYGWPHKFYIEPVNPDVRPCWQGASTDGVDENGVRKVADGTHPDDYWTCRAHGSEIDFGAQAFCDLPGKPECACPRDKYTGYWSRGIRGKYQTLYFKFYNIHLHDASVEEFAEFAELSKRIFGIEWQRIGPVGGVQIKWSAPPTNSFYGYQRAGEINAQGEAVRTL